MVKETRACRAVLAALAVLAMTGASWGSEPRARKNLKYHFKIVEVTGAVAPDVRTMGRKLLEEELRGRDEFTADAAAPGAGGKALRSFDVSLKFESLSQDLKDPRPGSRLKQLAVGVKLSIFGAQSVDKKMAFSGNGESLQIGEIAEREREKEAQSLTRDVSADAIKQAVDQAVIKLSLPASEPVNEARGKGKKKRKAAAVGSATK
jgi:hypothetical protein